MFKKQVSATPCIFYRNSLFVQKKDKIGAFYKQGSGLTHSLVQENPEKNNSKASFSLDCAKYPPPLQSKAKPLAPLSCRFARSTGDPPGGRGVKPHTPGLAPSSSLLPLALRPKSPSLSAPALGGHHDQGSSAVPREGGAGWTCRRCGAELLLLARLSPAKPAPRFQLHAGWSLSSTCIGTGLSKGLQWPAGIQVKGQMVTAPLEQPFPQAAASATGPVCGHR